MGSRTDIDVGLFQVNGSLTGPTGHKEEVEFLVDPVAKRLIPAEGFVG